MSNATVEHLGLGRIQSVHAHYVNGEVVQVAKLDGQSGVVATITGKEARKRFDVDRVVDIVHGALNGGEIREGASDQLDGPGEQESSKGSRDREGSG